MLKLEKAKEGSASDWGSYTGSVQNNELTDNHLLGGAAFVALVHELWSLWKLLISAALSKDMTESSLILKAVRSALPEKTNATRTEMLSVRNDEYSVCVCVRVCMYVGGSTLSASAVSTENSLCVCTTGRSIIIALHRPSSLMHIHAVYQKKVGEG